MREPGHNPGRREVRATSSREKELAEKIAAMPPELQDKFLDQARGAELALNILDPARAEKSPGDEQRKEG